MGWVKRWAPVALAALLAAGPGAAWAGGRHHGHGHGHHHSGRYWVGIGVPYPYYYPSPVYVGPRYYAPYPVVYPPYAVYPPRVVVQEPPVYIERGSEAQGSWYYCESAGAYYPDVETCDEPWVRVPARD